MMNGNNRLILAASVLAFVGAGRLALSAQEKCGTIPEGSR